MRKADNLPPSCADVTKSGNLNYLELSGPLRACNGTALLSSVLGIGPRFLGRKALSLVAVLTSLSFLRVEKRLIEGKCGSVSDVCCCMTD